MSEFESLDSLKNMLALKKVPYKLTSLCLTTLITTLCTDPPSIYLSVGVDPDDVHVHLFWSRNVWGAIFRLGWQAKNNITTPLHTHYVWNAI